MPIPLLLIGLGVATSALGIGKTVKAGIDQSDATDTNAYAYEIIENATDRANKSRTNSNDAITSLGNVKVAILDQSIKPFVLAFEKLHKVELSKSVGLDELKKFRINEQSLMELRDIQTLGSSIASGLAGSAALGAITAFGAYGATSTFVATSTSTAVASLTSIAATNSTLLFLGSGSMLAGSIGSTTVVTMLGASWVLGPGLAVMGFIVGGKASENKSIAYSNLSRANKCKEELDLAISICKGIRMRANMFERLLIKLNGVFELLVYSLEEIIATSGTDYSTYTSDQKAVVATSMSIAGAIKAVIDTPILTEDGKLTVESEKIAKSVTEALGNLKR